MALTGLRPIPVPPGLPTCVTGWGRWRCSWGQADKSITKSARPWIRRCRLPKGRRTRHQRVAMSTSPSTTRVRHFVDANGEGSILDEPAARGQRFGTRWMEDHRGTHEVPPFDSHAGLLPQPSVTRRGVEIPNTTHPPTPIPLTMLRRGPRRSIVGRSIRQWLTLSFRCGSFQFGRTKWQV